MEKRQRKKWLHTPAPISSEAFLQLEKRYGYSVDALREMAKELRMGRPKFEMHLLYEAFMQKKIQGKQTS